MPIITTTTTETSSNGSIQTTTTTVATPDAPSTVAMTAVEPAEAPSTSTSRGRLFCLCGGTRGDQQPLVMTALALKDMGYDITLCIGEEGAAWTKEFGFQHIELESFVKIVERDDVRHSAETNDFNAFMAAIGDACLDSMVVEMPTVYKAVKADPSTVGIVCTSTHWTMASVLARACDLPALPMFFSPMTITQDYPPFFIDTRDPNTWQSVPNPDGSTPGPFADMAELPQATFQPLWAGLHDMLGDTFLGPFKAAIELSGAADKFPDLPDDASKKAYLKEILNCEPRAHKQFPSMFCYSPAIVEHGPSDATAIQKSVQMGFCFDRATGDSEMSPFSPELEAFLNGGDPPVYLGWGSMSREHNDELCRAAVGACKAAGKRGIILGGWAKLNIGMLDAVKDKALLDYCKDNIHFTSKANHIQLFPRCCATVTHAGMGTFAAMLRGGVPGIVCPVWWDQTFCGDRMEFLKLGKRGPHFAKVTAENLGALITEVLAKPEYAANAAAMRKRLLAEKPGDVACAEYIDNHIWNVWEPPALDNNWLEAA